MTNIKFLKDDFSDTDNETIGNWNKKVLLSTVKQPLPSHINIFE